MRIKLKASCLLVGTELTAEGDGLRQSVSWYTCHVRHVVLGTFKPIPVLSMVGWPTLEMAHS